MTPRLPVPITRLYDIGHRTYKSWRGDRTLRLGAGLAYYALFTIVPFLAVTAALAEPLFGQAEVAEYVAARLEPLGVADPDTTAAAITDRFNSQSTQASLGLVGAVSLLFSASFLFLALTDAINTIWDEPVHSGWWNTIRRRLLSFLMVLISSAAIVLQLAISAIVGAAEALVPGDVPLIEALAPVVTSGFSWAGLAGIVMLLFRYMSPGDVPWRSAFVAGITTAVFLVLATWAVGWYLREFGGASVTGAFGAILAVLTWVYAEAQILLAGVQLSKVLALEQRAPEDASAADDGDGNG